LNIGFSKSLCVALLAGTAFTPAFAQQDPPPANPPVPADPAPVEAAPLEDAAAPTDEELLEEELLEEEEGGESIVVTGVRRPLRGAVPGNIEPEIQLDPRDIRTYGAGSLNELLDALSPQTQSGRGRGGERPVILLNGRRISSFAEIRDIPPEALLRVDILPEEAALQLGYRADQRVVNFVLRRRFRAITTEADYGFATAGGRPSYEAEANILRLNRNGRWSLATQYSHSGALTETERGLDDPFRTLLPATDQASVNGTFNRALSENVSGTLNGRFEVSRNNSLLGLGPEDSLGLARPLDRDSDSWNGHLGLALNGDLDDWRWSLTSNYDRTRSLVRTDSRLDPTAVRDRVVTRTELANAELLFNGPLLDLPAGDVRTSVTLGGERRAIAGESFRAGVDQERDLSRGLVFGQATLDVPIASRRGDFLRALGNLSANVNSRIEHYSDFGTLTTFGYGLNWSPIEAVNLRASVTHEDGAPSVQQLGDPTVATPGVRVIDFTTGQTVDIIRIDGGSPALLADSRRVISLGARIRPIEDEDLVFTANYTDTRIENPIASFPTATPEIEAAFPDRFVRDASGRLVSIDARPVNFARSDREELRWGLNWSQPIGPQRPPGGWRQRARAARGEGAAPNAAGQGAAPQEPAPPQGAPTETDQAEGRRGGGERGGRGFGGGGRGFGRFGGGGGRLGGRLQLSAYHTIRFEDRVLIREGVPPLDFLNGSAAGNRGGRPRHEVEMQAGITRNGLGARLSANWQSGTIVRNAGIGDLEFSDLATFNLRLFADLGAQRRLVEQVPFFRGARVSLIVNNLFDSRPQVTDAFGETPLAYRGPFLDPLGRSVRISFRKQFFPGGGQRPFARPQ
jgi:hypothetical protein